MRTRNEVLAFGSRRQILLLLGWYSPLLHRGIARYAREARWALAIDYHVVGRPPRLARCDGVICLVTPEMYPAVRPYLHLPMVDMGEAWVVHMTGKARAAGRKCPRVLFDDPGIARLAAQHLRDHGFRDIVFFNRGNFFYERARLPVFRKLVERSGARFHEIRYFDHFDHFAPRPGQSVLKAHRRLVRELSKLPKPAGLFVSNDDSSLLVFQACADAGIEVPGEIALLGCGNDPLVCDYLPVPLSSVDNNLDGQGYEAARLLDHLMRGGRAPDGPVIVTPKHVVTRQSTNVLAVAHPKVARALHFIWENYQHPIQTDDVAAAAGMARRSLHEVFLKHLGHTASEEITRRRIEHARELLLETGLKAAQIAGKCGFSGIVHFSQTFTRVVGERPSVYRRVHKVS